ncbi:AAA family ATPase [Lacticaseibacillus yichunensis]|uniref:AAA family ATPase n=1 Tax=Lacticaseibacillus yichunensis TaxID=2486015 RepID=A0ABW4CPE0_9LACO|nr:AAA family ATPase [Lacticaseibacillus yichunensis]
MSENDFDLDFDTVFSDVAQEATGTFSNADLMATATRMFHKYTDQGGLINLFRVTANVMPADPRPDEEAAFQFFAGPGAASKLVIPGPDDMDLFKADRERAENALARDANTKLTIVTDSTLSYTLFLTQLAHDLAASTSPSLAHKSILTASSWQLAESTDDLIYVAHLTPAEYKVIRSKTTDAAFTPHFEDGTSAFEKSRLTAPLFLPLRTLGVSDVAYVLRHFSEHYETSHHVTFAPDALVQLASGSRAIMTNLPDPEKAILLMDELGGEFAGTAEAPVTITKEMVQDTLATRYNTFPASVLNKESILGLENTLNDGVIGQTQATHAVAQAMARASVGLNNPHRPLATFLFVGPTGVGKTELAKQLTLALYGRETEYLRFDMSEFSSPEEGVFKLIGIASVYKNSERGGLLTNALREHPNAILLFDEFEKAARPVQNLMLQMLDDARLTAGDGQLFSLRSNIMIFTSNAGMAPSDMHVGFGNTEAGADYAFSTEAFTKAFPKELQNRFSNIIEFKPISKPDLFKILEIKLKRFYQLFESQGISLSLTDAVKTKLVALGYKPDRGARPLERAIDDALMGPIADLLLTTEDTHQINVDVDEDDKIVARAAAIKVTPPLTFKTAAVLYVDGAFNPQTGTYGYGSVLAQDGKTDVISGAGQEKITLNLRDYGGEMAGVLAGLEKAQAANIKELTIVYDYNGIEGWGTGRWQANHPTAVAYRDKMAQLRNEMTLYFVHTRKETSAEMKEANNEAKKAVGLTN